MSRICQWYAFHCYRRDPVLVALGPMVYAYSVILIGFLEIAQYLLSLGAELDVADEVTRLRCQPCIDSPS